ncbi:heterokaryon incompatibility protein [Cordyceps javanica]|uniref:Heterokaryon incompatibility protein n=1 Tax=Cordyceps javanica TaxID=43265 RepID=A0A545VT70_9HYPO|nr:heterokaryon incompatibility protein [Cordyceps javanica]TQW04875.1 heterokaryon incompatibility protein [Cordyceps javanica]
MASSTPLESRCQEEALGQPCETCELILQFLHGSDSEQNYGELGSFEELTSGKCKKHARFIRSYVPLYNNSVDRDFPYKTSDITLHKIHRKGAVLVFTDRVSRYETLTKAFSFLAPRKELEVGDDQPQGSSLVDVSPIRGLKIDSTSSKAFTVLAPRKELEAGDDQPQGSSWIDLNTIRGWMDVCYTRHKECARLTSSQQLREHCPSYLIDLKSFCLVKGSQAMSYWALSYVWGGVSQLLLSTTTVDMLQQPQSLHETNAQLQIPLTVRHAMALAKTLGSKYFWVDSLCIIQDDDDLRNVELSNMSSIFDRASVVIVAGNGSHANHGLPGLYNISSPRDLDESHVLDNGARIVELRLPAQNSRSLGASSLRKWKSRGWTFQESFFSRRKLFFYDGHVGWECSRQCGLEGLGSETTRAMTDISIEHSLNYQLSRIQRHRQFVGEVWQIDGVIANIADFNAREFTYPEDALDAFSGIASFWHSKSNGALGFVSGLPLPFFSLSLLWHDGAANTRREPSKGRPGYCLPSWSWVGWENANPVKYWDSVTLCQVQFRNIGKVSSWRDKVNSSVQWQAHAAINRRENIDLSDKWALIRDRYINNVTEPVPTGWTRHTLSPEHSQEICEKHIRRLLDSDWGSRDIDNNVCHPVCYYSHKSDPHGKYLFPRPVSRVSEKQRHSHIQLISCNTLRVYLTVGVLLKNYGRKGHTCELHDKDGELVGALDCLHVLLPDGQAGFYPSPGSEVELVEVAHGTKMLEPYTQRGEQDIPELREEDWPIEGSTYEYIWVLGIVWQQGIAYRDSIGRVMRDQWVKLKKDRIDLVLG